jgi:flagellar biosynthetic protein FlhB
MKMQKDEHKSAAKGIELPVGILGIQKNENINTSCGIQPVDLQLFADSGDKTEKATPRKRKKAREEGQVLQSRELTSAIVLLSVFVTLRIAGGFMYEQIYAYFKVTLADYQKINYIFTINGLTKLFIDLILRFFKIVAPIFAIALITAFAASYAQVGFLFTTKTLKFKFSKLNPLNGFKRIFSMRSVAELVKSILKITIIGYIGYSYLMGEAKKILRTMDMDVASIATYICITALNVAIRMCVAMLIIGVLDYIYQWWEHEKSLKMSKHEVKQEHKETEGNPEVKGKIRQKQRQMAMRRMLQDIPKADVVITNPTHFAVAIKYDSKVSDAPIVLAKGQDYIALRIKEIAKENKVEIVENKPLARTLFQTVEIGEKIPPELFQAVAEVLAFVYNLKNKGSVV